MKKKVDISKILSHIASLKGISRWHKSDYAYAVCAMDIHSLMFGSFLDCYKLQEVKDKFVSLLPDRFHLIAGFSTFKEDNFYLTN